MGRKIFTWTLIGVCWLVLLLISLKCNAQVIDKGATNEIWRVKGGYQFVQYLKVPRKYNKVAGADTVGQIWCDSVGHLYVFDSVHKKGVMLLGIGDTDLIQEYAATGADAQTLSIGHDTLFIENGNYVVLPAGLNGTDGADGADGATWYTGSGAPGNGSGVDNDLYLRTSNGDVYKKTSGSWSVVANITGPQGPSGATGAAGATGPAGANGTNGTDGATWITGTGSPVGYGVNSDLYLDISNGDVYKKTAGSWNLITNIKGPQGATGATGAAGTNGTNGTNGTDGATWYSGSGAPGSGTGVNGDHYLRTSNGDVYLKSGGSWSVVTNITGPQGPTGATGATGSAGPNTVTTSTTTTGTGFVYGTGSVISFKSAVALGSEVSGILPVANGGTGATVTTSVNGTPVPYGANTTVTAAPSGSAGGDLTGNFPNPTLGTSGVTAGTYGSAAVMAIIVVDAKGRVTGVTTANVTPAISNVTGMGTGVGTFLVTPSSSNLAAALTDELGSGYAVFYPADTSVSASYTLTTRDLNRTIHCTNGSSINITVPTSLGTNFTCIVMREGAGDVVFVASSTTLTYIPTSTTKLKQSGSAATIRSWATANTFTIQGDLN